MYGFSNSKCPKAFRNHTKKKTITYRERDEEARTAFQGELGKTPPELVVYVDETGIDQYIYRPYGRAPKGKTVSGKISGRKYKRTSIVSGLLQSQAIAPLQYSGTMDSKLFNYWFQNILLPALACGCVIVLDNARFHQKKVLAELAKQHGCLVLFLPPYSPDLNPIENFWAWLKARLRKVLPLFDSFNDALTDCFNVV